MALHVLFVARIMPVAVGFCAFGNLFFTAGCVEICNHFFVMVRVLLRLCLCHDVYGLVMHGGGVWLWLLPLPRGTRPCDVNVHVVLSLVWLASFIAIILTMAEP